MTPTPPELLPKILMVDDNPAKLLSVRSMLEGAAAEAANGKVEPAINASFLRCESDRRPRKILLFVAIGSHDPFRFIWSHKS